MKTYDFNEIIVRKGTDCVKYDALNKYFGQSDLVPLWVADMDFRTPDFIIHAIKERCEHPIFGYSFPTPEYYESIIHWVKDLHGWDIREEWISFIPGIVKGIAYVIEHFTQKGDKIIIQPPVYHPFRLVSENLGRTIVNNPLKLVNGAYAMDFEQLESVIDKDCKLLILSNPHNPGGMVWEKETLQRLAEICYANHILVISDEIHSEMVFSPHRHYPFATVSQEAEAISITFSAPTKTFNLAGIVSSYAIVPNDQLRSDFYSYLSAGEFNQGSIFGYLAAIAAYRHGASWRLQLLDYLTENMRFVDNFLKKNIPSIKAYLPEASFLVWLDCRSLNLTQKKLVSLFKEKAGLALNDGAMFGPGGEGYMRLNVGCPQKTLENALVLLKNHI